MSKRLLIIDDEANVRLALRSRLSKLDCDVLEAATLEDATQLIIQHKRDLRVVILDLRLVAAQEEEGRESGLRLLKEELASPQICVERGLSRVSPGVSVIVLTAYPNVQSCREAFLAGAMDYLDKNDACVWDVLLDRVSLGLEHSKEQMMFAAKAWIDSHRDEVLREYTDQTLALRGENIVAAARSLDELKESLRGRGLNPDDCLFVTISKE